MPYSMTGPTRRRERKTMSKTHHPITITALAALGALASSQAMAQMPPDIAEKIAAIGRKVDGENTGKIYTPLQEKEPYAGIKVTRDVKYSGDARNVVDIFVPEA